MILLDLTHYCFFNYQTFEKAVVFRQRKKDNVRAYIKLVGA